MSAGYFMRNKWTEEEINILKQHLEELSLKELKVLLPYRTEEAIQKKIKRDGFSYKKYNNQWTNIEINVIKKYFHLKDKNFIIKLLPNRTWESIYAKARNLGYKREQFFWSSNDDELLIRMYPTENKQEIMRILEKSWSAISNRATKLGIKRLSYGKTIDRRAWTAREDKLLTMYYPVMKKNDLEVFFKRSSSSIRTRASDLGLRKIRYKNEISINGDSTIIYVNLKKQKLSAYIDTINVDKVLSYPNKWYAKQFKSGGIYAYTNIKDKNGKTKEIAMHRAIKDCPDNFIVDHIDHNGLNNREYNLRVCNHAENRQNLLTNKDGVLGVFWDKKSNKWRVKVKRINFGIYTSYDEAVYIATQAKSLTMPFSKESLIKPINPDGRVLKYIENFHQGISNKQQGESHYASKLTEAQVREIKSNKDISAYRFAKMFGVNSTAIDKIRSGKSWKHIIVD